MPWADARVLGKNAMHRSIDAVSWCWWTSNWSVCHAETAKSLPPFRLGVRFGCMCFENSFNLHRCRFIYLWYVFVSSDVGIPTIRLVNGIRVLWSNDDGKQQVSTSHYTLICASIVAFFSQAV
ncbi:unnamed protein product [Ectocarpus sp. 12 AP-2014]